MEKDRKKTKFIHQPEYPGGPKELTRFIYENLRYPAAALEANAEGTVLVEYDIDYLGNVMTTKVLHSVGHGCDEEASRVVRLLKFDVPKNRGVHVVFHQKVRVQFKKPKPQPAPAPNMQVSYTVSAAPKPAQVASRKPKESQTYTYTVKL